MRILMIGVSVLALAACNRGATTNNSAAPANAATANAAAPAPAANTAAPAAPAAAAAAVAGGPPGFPDADPVVRSVECVVFLGLSRQAGTTPAGRDDPIMEQAQGQWQAALMTGSNMNETDAKQLIGSSVNPMMTVPAAQRDAASAWCVENAPEVDPDSAAK